MRGILKIMGESAAGMFVKGVEKICYSTGVLVEF